MRRLLWLALLAASLLPFSGPARAQATADQLNKLSLEALTAPPPGGGGGGYSRRSYRPTYHRSTRSYARVSYHGSRRYGRRYASIRRYTPVRHVAVGSRYAFHARPVSRQRAHVSRVTYTRHHAAPAYQRPRHR